MNRLLVVWLCAISIIGHISCVNSVELTFELPDNAHECFYQEIPANTSCTLEFQVVTGGQYDVDVTLTSPQKEVLYKQIKTQFDSYSFTTKTSGTYAACFSNEFSTFSHKLVYMDFQIGDEPALPGVGEKDTALTQMESSASEIHKHLTSIVDAQTHHRLRETQGRKRAEELNETVMLWSLFETGGILMVSFFQVYIIKRFFSDKQTISATKVAF